jgi:hypothetical protein
MSPEELLNRRAVLARGLAIGAGVIGAGTLGIRPAAATDLGNQDGWRWCGNCRGLFFGPINIGGDCPATHEEHDGTNSWKYRMPYFTNGPDPADTSTHQGGWRWCSRCEGLAFSRNGTGRCPLGGGHDYSGSARYMLFHDADLPSYQDNWRWCSKCAGLSYGPQAASSSCPAGGHHSTAGSANYQVLITPILP